jgi:hypothetical protein
MSFELRIAKWEFRIAKRGLRNENWKWRWRRNFSGRSVPKSAIRNPRNEIRFRILKKELEARTKRFALSAIEFVEANLTTSTSSEELLREVRELLAIFVASGRTAKSRR